jgi:hypothetical protein
MHPTQPARWLLLAAGALDLASGLGLALSPAAALRAAGGPVPGAEALPYVRFVGAFVLAVGACCLWAGVGPDGRLRAVLGATIFFRLATGTYAGAAVAAGWLPGAWLAVAAADAALIGAQAWLLAKGAGQHG